MKYKKQTSVWSTNLTAMGIKTVLKMILGTYGIMSIDMQDAFIEDNKSFDNVLNENAEHVESTMGSEVIDIEVKEPEKKAETKKDKPAKPKNAKVQKTDKNDNDFPECPF